MILFILKLLASSLYPWVPRSNSSTCRVTWPISLLLYLLPGMCTWSVMSDSAAPWTVAHQAPLSRDSSVQGISPSRNLQAKILEWIAMPSSRGSFWLEDWTGVSYISCTGRQVLYHYCHLWSPRLCIYTQVFWIPTMYWGEFWLLCNLFYL